MNPAPPVTSEIGTLARTIASLTAGVGPTAPRRRRVRETAQVRFLRDRQARPAVLASALVALLAGLLVARQAVVSAWDTIWAEDGFAFLSDAVSGNALAAVVEPHGGYIHPLPRAAAAVAAVLPLDRAALVFSIAWALVVALLAAFVYAASGEILRSRARSPRSPRCCRPPGPSCSQIRRTSTSTSSTRASGRSSGERRAQQRSPHARRWSPSRR